MSLFIGFEVVSQSYKDSKQQLLFQILACLIACALAAPYYPYGYAHGLPADLAPAVVQNGLVAHPNGAVTPALTPSVAAATHAHLATKFGPYAYWG